MKLQMVTVCSVPQAKVVAWSRLIALDIGRLVVQTAVTRCSKLLSQSVVRVRLVKQNMDRMQLASTATEPAWRRLIVKGHGQIVKGTAAIRCTLSP